MGSAKGQGVVWGDGMGSREVGGLAGQGWSLRAGTGRSSPGAGRNEKGVVGMSRWRCVSGNWGKLMGSKAASGQGISLWANR